jgi:hypothetical protein
LWGFANREGSVQREIGKVQRVYGHGTLRYETLLTKSVHQLHYVMFFIVLLLKNKNIEYCVLQFWRQSKLTVTWNRTRTFKLCNFKMVKHVHEWVIVLLRFSFLIFSCLSLFRYPDYNSIVEAGLMLPFGNKSSIILIC